VAIPRVSAYSDAYSLHVSSSAVMTLRHRRLVTLRLNDCQSLSRAAVEGSGPFDVEALGSRARRERELKTQETCAELLPHKAPFHLLLTRIIGIMEVEGKSSVP
jgi:hypothetical protein